MLTEIKTASGAQYAFTFPAGSGERAGEQYRLGLRFCDNPVCRCGIVTVRLLPDEPGSVTEYTAAHTPSCEAILDLFKQKLDTGNQPGSVSQQAAGAALVRALSEQDWQLLSRIFYAYKRQITDDTPDDRIEASFPVADIVQDSAMVSFHGILPYADYTTLQIDDRHFQLDELYCVKSDCACTDVAVGLLDLSAQQDVADIALLAPVAVLFFNYRTQHWRIEEAGDEDLPFLNRIAETLKADAKARSFQRHHARLKSLYRAYQARHSRHAISVPALQSVGRSDP